MARVGAVPISLRDRVEALRGTLTGLESELARLLREEQYLTLQSRRAREQVRYYEQLLVDLRREWGKPPALSELVRRLGKT